MGMVTVPTVTIPNASQRSHRIGRPFGREGYGPQYGPPSVSQSISRSVSIPSEGIPPSRAASGGIEIIYRGGNMVPGTRIVPPCGPMRALEIRTLEKSPGV